MFKVKKDETVATEERAEGGRGEIGLAYVNGCQVFSVVGRKLRVMASGGVGCTVQYEILPLPSGRPIGLGAGPSVLMADGALFYWQSEKWHRVGDLLDGPQP